jgi:hypothetical protein
MEYWLSRLLDYGCKEGDERDECYEIRDEMDDLPSQHRKLYGGPEQ